MSDKFSVTIRVDDKEIEQLKSLLAQHPHKAKWEDWQDFAGTVAFLGFVDALRERIELRERAQQRYDLLVSEIARDTE